MSLNGLEASDINEAYYTALTEGGCWFVIFDDGRTQEP